MIVDITCTYPPLPSYALIELDHHGFIYYSMGTKKDGTPLMTCSNYLNTEAFCNYCGMDNDELLYWILIYGNTLPYQRWEYQYI